MFLNRNFSVPWVVQIHLFLLFFFAGLLLLSFYVGQGQPKANDLYNLAASGLQMVLGALLGALSWAAENFFRDRDHLSNDSTQSETVQHPANRAVRSDASSERQQQNRLARVAGGSR